MRTLREANLVTCDQIQNVKKVAPIRDVWSRREFEIQFIARIARENKIPILHRLSRIWSGGPCANLRLGRIDWIVEHTRCVCGDLTRQLCCEQVK